MIIGNNVRQITMDGHVVPDDNTYGILHGPDRRHPEFATVVYASQIKAQEMHRQTTLFIAINCTPVLFLNEKTRLHS